MTYLIFILATIVLLAAFVGLVAFEGSRGSRLFEKERARLDASVTHLVFILRNVDFGSFVRSETRRLAGWGSHAAAASILTGVRAAERLLTRIVRALRSRHALELEPRASARQFVRTLSEFKGQLEAARVPSKPAPYTAS